MSSLFYYEPYSDFERLIDNAMRSYSGSTRTTDSPSWGLTNRDSSNAPGRASRPRMDLHEDSDKNIVSATFELPGIKKEDVQIDIHDGMLTVSADTKASADHEESGYAVRERRFGKISRSLRLPTGVTENDVNAGMENGILTVRFPKRSAQTEPKRITIT